MNLNDFSKILRRLKAGTTEMPPLPGKPVSGNCWVPACRMDGDEVINDYCDLKLNGISQGRHVVAAGLLRGEFDETLIVMHLCDRKPCCNPWHLRWGTNAENAQQAWERGLSQPTGKPSAQRGEKNCRAKATNAEMADIKWLLENLDQWHTPEIAAHHSPLAALAIHYEKTEPSLKQMKRRENWRSIEPCRPVLLPTRADIPPDAKPPQPKKDGPIGPKNAELILREYPTTTDKRHFVQKWRKLLKVSVVAIYHVLTGKTWKEVAPEIPRVAFSTHGMQKLSSRAIQEIRATCDANPTYVGKGLYAALARKFHVKVSWIGVIVQGLARLDIDDDPTAEIPLTELEFKDLTPKGAAHPSHKISDAQFMEILRLLDARERVSVIAKRYRVSIQVIYKIRKGQARPDVRQQHEAEKLASGGCLPSNPTNGDVEKRDQDKPK